VFAAARVAVTYWVRPLRDGDRLRRRRGVLLPAFPLGLSWAAASWAAGDVRSFKIGGVKRAIDVGPFGELADPRVAARLAARAEEQGWDGFFVWDHIDYRAPVRAVADPWVTLAAVACATSRVRIGALVTPLSRRRVHKVARETATLDLLSSGRLIFGAGLGSTRNNELEPFGEVTDPRERARLLDHRP